MITELSIEGFKSLGSPAETIELGPLNFVVGANASGKSNLLGALRFLQNAVALDVSYAVSEMGGNAEVRNKRLRQRRQEKPVRLSLKIEKNFRFTSSEDSEKEDHVYVVRSFEAKIRWSSLMPYTKKAHIPSLSLSRNQRDLRWWASAFFPCQRRSLERR